MDVGVALDLLQDPAVGVRGGDVPLDGTRVKRALVFEEVELLVAGLRVDLVDLLAFVEEDAVDPDVRADLHHVVVDEVAVADRVLVVVAVREVLEVRHGVGRGGGGEPDLDRVEVIERLAPDRLLLRRVAAVTLVGDDQVEGVDRDVELLHVGVDVLVVDPQRLLATEEVHRHSLDRRDVDEGVAELRRGQQRIGQDRRIEPIVTKVGLLEAL